MRNLVRQKRSKQHIWEILIYRIPSQLSDQAVVCTHACVLSPFSRVRPFVTLWAVARQAPLSMGFSRQEYWSGLPCPPPGDLHDSGLEPVSLVSYIGRWVLYH